MWWRRYSPTHLRTCQSLPAPFAVALPHVVGFPDLGVLRRLRPIDTLRPATRLSPRREERVVDGSHVHCCSVDGRGARLCPCGLVVATPQTFTTTCRARHTHRPDSSPRRPPAWLTAPGTVTHRTPAPIHRISSGSTIKRLYDTGSSRAPSRLAHQARPVR